jgi:hypothetical protein
VGVQWELIDKRNRRVFDMDKLYVGGLVGAAPMTPREVLAAYSKAHAERYGDQDAIDDHDRHVAARIWAFCDVAGWDLDMHNDMGDDDSTGYAMVDGRVGGPFDADPCAEQTATATRAALAALEDT